MQRAAAGAVLAAVLLGGCTLIDQNTFYANASAAPVVPKPPAAPVVAPTPPGRPPLLTVSAQVKPADYAAALRRAVADARARKPDVVFDVVEMEKPDAPGDVVLGAAAAEVARSIVALGVEPARVRLAARPDASAVPKEVRVYVR